MVVHGPRGGHVTPFQDAGDLSHVANLVPLGPPPLRADFRENPLRAYDLVKIYE